MLTLQRFDVPPQFIQGRADVIQGIPCFRHISLHGQTAQITGITFIQHDGSLNQQPHFAECVARNPQIIRSHKWHGTFVCISCSGLIESCIGIVSDLYCGKISNTTINNYIRNLKAYFAWLVEMEMLTVSPLRRVKPLPEERKPKEYMDDDEVKRLLKCMDKSYYAEL